MSTVHSGEYLLPGLSTGVPLEYWSVVSKDLARFGGLTRRIEYWSVGTEDWSGVVTLKTEYWSVEGLLTSHPHPMIHGRVKLCPPLQCVQYGIDVHFTQYSIQLTVGTGFTVCSVCTVCTECTVCTVQCVKYVQCVQCVQVVQYSVYSVYIVYSVYRLYSVYSTVCSLTLVAALTISHAFTAKAGRARRWRFGAAWELNSQAGKVEQLESNEEGNVGYIKNVQGSLDGNRPLQC